MKKIFSVIAMLAVLGTFLIPAIPASAWATRWTGGGTIDTGADIPAGVRVTHGFEIYVTSPEAPAGPNHIEVNWGGNHFHLTSLTYALSYFDANYPPPDPPHSPDNIIQGYGIGRYNGADGYHITFTFTDFGEPGVNDYAQIVIKSPDESTTVLDVTGNLDNGNHQSHAIK